ncbi:hypothetical protein IMG5_175120, partial [Ichthyophthirius multifiliis]
MEQNFLIFLYTITYLDPKTNLNLYERLIRSVGNGQQAIFKLDRLYKVIENFRNAMLEQGQTIKTIKLYEVLINSLSKQNLKITRFHTYFLEACLISKMYKSALRIIDVPIVQLDSKSCVNEEDVLNFFYFSGCIYLGLK